MTLLIVLGSIAIWFAGSGVRSELRPEDSDLRWSMMNIDDSAAPFLNLLWPLELLLVMPAMFGGAVVRGLRGVNKRRALPEARVVER